MKNLDLVFHIPDVFCQNCFTTIEKALQKKFNINSISPNLSQKTLKLCISVDGELSEADIISSLIDTVDNVSFRMTRICPQLQADNTHPPKDNTHFISALLGLSLGLIWMLASLGVFSFAVMSTWPFILANNLTLIYLAMPFVRKAWLALMAGIKKDAAIPPLQMDSLFVMTGFIIVTSSMLSLFFPIFSNPLEAGFLIFGFRHLGCMVQAYLDQKMRMSSSFTQTFQDKVYELADGRRIAARDLEPGHEIILNADEVLPVDAKLTRSENAKIKNTLHDGGLLGTADIPENLPAGVELLEGKLYLTVTSDLANSRLGLIDKALEHMKQGPPSKLLDKVERGLQWFIPIILALALISGILVAYFFSVALAIKCMTAVLVSACPCTLGLIIPMASKLGAYRASQKKVIFQTAQALEDAAQVDTFVLDYNGTLTTGTPSFTDFQCDENSPISYNDCLAGILSIEQKVLEKRPDDRLAKAIINRFARESVPNSNEGATVIDNVNTYSLQTKKGTFLFGNNVLLQDKPSMEGYMRPQALHLLWEDSQGEISYLGHLQEQDSLRCDAREFIQKLRSKGKTVTVCTGADEQTAEKICHDLGVKVIANQRIEDKSKYVEELQKNQHKVVMIGDAINDLAAFKTSDLGIWFKSDQGLAHWGDEKLRGVADMLIYSDRLMDILDGLDIATQTAHVIYQNLLFSLIYNLLSVTLACGLLLSFGISLPPALGVALMILQSVCLAFNAWRGIGQQDAASDVGLSRSALAAT
ncbi:MAG: cation-translocating P-type ATPase [Gammaproteobacteria bacterium]|nr:cation-translocating P-type ATPase [Gammaproteobacteria bacterium]